LLFLLYFLFSSFFEKKMPKGAKGTKMSWGDLQALGEEADAARRKTEQAKRTALAEAQKEKEAAEVEAAEEKRKGYKNEIVRDYSLPATEVPEGVQLVAFEFALLVLLNVDFFICRTVTAFKVLFQPFYLKYILAVNQFESCFSFKERVDIQEWIATYAVTRKSEKFRRSQYEDCWRFLIYVSAEACLKSIATVFPDWVSISETGDLTWNITPEILAGQQFPIYRWHGFHKHQAAKKAQAEARRAKYYAQSDDD
jgi:hypothetical protein